MAEGEKYDAYGNLLPAANNAVENALYDRRMEQNRFKIGAHYPLICSQNEMPC